MDTTPLGSVVPHLHVVPRAFLPMRGMEAVGLEGRGIVGDRYMIGTEQGFYRARRARRCTRCSAPPRRAATPIAATPIAAAPPG
jgi:hypothetical protein